jgi:hypothetical protein
MRIAYIISYALLFAFSSLCVLLCIDTQVWAEIWSETQQRWIHCDPCENAFDGPLLYEAGWGKKLSYIVAFSRDECVDVSRRYTAKFATEVCARRNACTEDALAAIVRRTNEACLARLAPARQAEVRARQACEARELAGERVEREVRANEMIGRLTGSLDWRVARGELGSGAAAVAAMAGGAGAEIVSVSAAGAVSAAPIAPSPASAEASAATSNPITSAFPSTAMCATTEIAASSSSASASVDAASAPVTAAAVSSSPAALTKPELAALVKRYFAQLTQGCGRAAGTCANAHCRSSSAAAVDAAAPVPAPRSANDTAREAVTLAARLRYSGLCEPIAAATAAAAQP